MVVHISKAGVVHLDGQPIEEQALLSKLRKAHASDGDLRAIISADRAVRHGRFVKAVDIVRQAGIARFAIDVQARGEDPEEDEP